MKNPFEDPDDLLEYILRDHLNRVSMELTGIIEGGLRSEESRVNSFEISGFLRKVPESISETVRANTRESFLEKDREEVEGKILGWLLSIGREAEIGPDTITYYWRRVQANCVIGA